MSNNENTSTDPKRSDAHMDDMRQRHLEKNRTAEGVLTRLEKPVIGRVDGDGHMFTQWISKFLSLIWMKQNNTEKRQ